MLIYRQFVIPASNAQSRDAELDRIALWAQANNLKLNRAKSVEIIFTDRRRKHAVCYLPAIPDIPRVTSIKILGVVFINLLSVSEHWARRWRHQQVCTVAPCTQSLALSRHEWRRAEGRIQVGGARLYASSAWWGFTTSSIKVQIEEIVRRGVRLSLYGADDPTAAELVADLDDTLFRSVLHNVRHVLHHILPDCTSMLPTCYMIDMIVH